MNQSVLETLRELGDVDLLTELVDLFFADVPPQLASLREAIESGDASSVKRVAHTLKGSCGNMGAQRMAALCARLQDIGASGYLTHAPELLKQLEAEFERVRPALEVEIAEG